MPLFLACFALSFSQGIDLNSRGETVAALLNEASKQSGILMEAAPQTRNEIVIVSVKGVSLDAFRTHLAQAIGGVWKQEGDTWRLGRPLAVEKAQIAAERKRKLADARVGVENLEKQVADQPVFDAQAAQRLATKVSNLYTKYKGHLSDAGGLSESVALEPQSPAGRLSIAAVGMLSAEQVADVGQGERVVYASNPTKAQRPLPGDLSKAIQRYVAEQTLYSKALRSVASSKEWQNSYSPLLARATPKMPSGILLCTAHSPYNPSLTVEVMLLDAGGKYITEVNTLLDLDAPAAATPPIKEGNVPLSPYAQRFYDGMQQLSKGKTFIDDSVLMGQMEYPEKNDPLSFIAADGLLGVSEGKNLIACIPDDGLAEPAFTSIEPDGKLNLAKFSNWLNGKCLAKQEADWLVATPVFPVQTRELRVDRGVIGPFFRQARRNNGATLNDILDVLTKVPAKYTETLIPYMAFFLLPDLNAAIDDQNIEMLRVLGRLGPQQRQGVLAGNPIRVSEMNLASHVDLNHLIYRADSPISISSSGPSGEDGFQGSLATEVTSALPNGVPEDAQFAVQVISSDVVIPDGGDSPASGYRPMSAWSLGFMLGRAEHADPTDKREQVKIEKYRFGHSRRYQLQLRVSENISLGGQLNENNVPRDKPAVTFDQLPQAFRDAVEKARAEARKQATEQGGGKVPPP